VPAELHHCHFVNCGVSLLLTHEPCLACGCRLDLTIRLRIIHGATSARWSSGKRDLRCYLSVRSCRCIYRELAANNTSSAAANQVDAGVLVVQQCFVPLATFGAWRPHGNCTQPQTCCTTTIYACLLTSHPVAKGSPRMSGGNRAQAFHL
jgi:hypothetical protein